MHKKKYFLLLSFLSFYLCGISQNYKGNPEVDVKAVAAFKSNTLLVVVDSIESNVGKAIVSSFNKYWKFTPFKFIKTSDIDKYLNDNNVSFFVFTLVGGYQKGKELLTPGLDLFDFEGKREFFILLDKTLIPGKIYYKNRNIAQSAKCCFAIFPGGPDLNKLDQGLYSGVNLLDYVTPTQPETGIYQNGVWHKQTQFDMYQTLNSDEQSTTPYIGFYVQRLEQHFEYISQHGDVPKIKKEEDKISWEYKGGANSESAKITSYDDGLQQIKTMKILVDSAISDELGKQLLAKSLGINESAIQLVPWSEIENAITQQTPGIAVLYQKKLDYTADIGYVFWTTDGKRLIDWNFRHIGTNSSYCFGFRKDDTFECDRNAVHLK